MINDPAVIFSWPCSIPDGSVNDVFLLHEYSNDWWIDYKKLWWAKTKKCHFCRHHHPLMKHITLLLQALDNFVPFWSRSLEMIILHIKMMKKIEKKRLGVWLSDSTNAENFKNEKKKPVIVFQKAIHMKRIKRAANYRSICCF